MNKIYRNLILIFILVWSLLFVVLSISMVKTNFDEETEYLSEIVEQVIGNIETAKQNYDKKMSLMTVVWLERAENLEAIISNDQLMRARPEALERLRVLSGAKALHIFDRQGLICVSTDQSLVGKIPEGEEELLRSFLESGEKSYVHVEESGFWQDPSYCRLIFRIEGAEEYAAFCIDADTAQMGLKCERSIIENTLREASTEYETSVVALGLDSGIVLGMTQNNEQRLDIKGIETTEKLIEFLEQSERRACTCTEINGEYSLVSMQKYDGAYIVAFGSMNALLRRQLNSWIRTLLLFVAAIGVLLAAMRYNFRKYLLCHLEEMENGLNQILDGNFDVTIRESNNPELNKLVRVIERLKAGYIHKSERSNKIVSALGDDIAIFECVFEMNYYFFSKRMKNMLVMTDEEWEQAMEQKNGLLALIDRLNEKRDENNIVYYKGKYLEVQVCQVKDELVGVIIDQTEEMTRRFKLESELKQSEQKQYTDALTKVRNRGGFELAVKRYLSESKEGGVLLAFDLDNFKTINDTLGHPAGDEVLQIFAAGLKELFRSGDIVGRLGGDEFSVFMTNPVRPDLAKRKTQLVMEQLKESFGEYHRTYGVSVSAGIAFAQAGESYESIYKAADEALYEAKKAGKNTYRVAERTAEDGEDVRAGYRNKAEKN